MTAALRTGLALGFLLLPALPAEAAEPVCETAVSARLDSLEIGPSDIRGIHYDVKRKNRGSDRIRNILAWVSLNSCRGHVVIDLSSQCRVRQVYGRGTCDLGGTLDVW
jgi:hypothetical protein